MQDAFEIIVHVTMKRGENADDYNDEEIVSVAKDFIEEYAQPSFESFKILSIRKLLIRDSSKD